ncbi:hypothetical protein C2E23DRAFT_733650, partial [Lenzites betulinus]
MASGADLHLRPDATYAQNGLEDEQMSAVVLVAYGPTYALTILFPTDDPSSITQKRVNAWMHLIWGPFLIQCEGSNKQFANLLDLALVYRAFLPLPGRGAQLTEDDFDDFTARLVQTALELHPLERADDELSELAGWLRVN